MEELSEFTITQIIARVALSLEDAVREHGTEAVDLALLAYRVDAAGSVIAGLFGLLLVTLTLPIMAYCRKAERQLEPRNKGFAVATGSVCSFVLLVVGFLIAVENLSLVNILAALGSPELLIATRTLEAGGLL